MRVDVLGDGTTNCRDHLRPKTPADRHDPTRRVAQLLGAGSTSSRARDRSAEQESGEGRSSKRGPRPAAIAHEQPTVHEHADELLGVERVSLCSAGAPALRSLPAARASDGAAAPRTCARLPHAGRQKQESLRRWGAHTRPRASRDSGRTITESTVGRIPSPSRRCDR